MQKFRQAFTAFKGKAAAFFRARGYYIALTACILVLCVAAVVAFSAFLLPLRPQARQLLLILSIVISDKQKSQQVCDSYSRRCHISQGCGSQHFFRLTLFRVIR